jgi:hypothetical protein
MWTRTAALYTCAVIGARFRLHRLNEAPAFARCLMCGTEKAAFLAKDAAWSRRARSAGPARLTYKTKRKMLDGKCRRQRCQISMSELRP